MESVDQESLSISQLVSIMDQEGGSSNVFRGKVATPQPLGPVVWIGRPLVYLVASDLSLTMMGGLCLASLTPAVFAQARGSFWTQGCTLGVNGHEQLWLIQSVFILQCQRQNLYGMSNPI